MDSLFRVVVKWAPIRIKTLQTIDIFPDYAPDLSGKAHCQYFHML